MYYSTDASYCDLSDFYVYFYYFYYKAFSVGKQMERRPVSPTSEMTSKVKGQGRKFTLCV